MTGWVSNSVSTSILLSLYPFECFIFLLWVYLRRWAVTKIRIGIQWWSHV
jgi:hypothetical protein